MPFARRPYVYLVTRYTLVLLLLLSSLYSLYHLPNVGYLVKEDLIRSGVLSDGIVNVTRTYAQESNLSVANQLAGGVLTYAITFLSLLFLSLNAGIASAGASLRMSTVLLAVDCILLPLLLYNTAMNQGSSPHWVCLSFAGLHTATLALFVGQLRYQQAPCLLDQMINMAVGNVHAMQPLAGGREDNQ